MSSKKPPHAGSSPAPTPTHPRPRPRPAPTPAPLNREANAPGIDAEQLRTALGFVLAVCPREGTAAVVVFDADAAGVPLMAAHDQARCHIAFLPMEAWCEARGAATRSNAKRLHRLLGGLDESDEATALLHEGGRVEIRRNGQPTLVHHLDLTSEVPRWRPPADDGATVTVDALSVSSEHLQRSARFPGATVTIEQRTSARVVVNHRMGDLVVARAVLAEYPHALYDGEQVRFDFLEGARDAMAQGGAR